MSIKTNRKNQKQSHVKKRAVNEESLKSPPVEQVFIDVQEEEHICRVCGTAMEPIGMEFVNRELKFIPAKVKILECYSVNYGCLKCRKETILPQIKMGKEGRAHICRYLIDAIPKGKQIDYTRPSVQGVMYVNLLFELEDKMRQKNAGDYEAIRKDRLEKEKPVVEGFLVWLRAAEAETST